MAEDHREQTFGIAAGAGELVGMADARRLDLDQHLAELRTFEIDRLDLELPSRSFLRPASRCADGGSGKYQFLPAAGPIALDQPTAAVGMSSMFPTPWPAV